MTDKIKVVAICGKASSGKDYLLKKVLNKDPNLFHKKISFTTRPKRNYEINGVDYNFITDEVLMQKILNNEILETSIFNGWAYGTTFDALSKDKINIGIYDPDGIEIISNDPNIDLLIFYLITDDKIRIMRSLFREQTPDIKEIFRRYSGDEEAFDNIENIFEKPYIKLINNSEKNTEANVKSIIRNTKQHFDIL